MKRDDVIENILQKHKKDLTISINYDYYLPLKIKLSNYHVTHSEIFEHFIKLITDGDEEINSIIEKYVARKIKKTIKVYDTQEFKTIANKLGIDNITEDMLYDLIGTSEEEESKNE